MLILSRRLAHILGRSITMQPAPRLRQDISCSLPPGSLIPLPEVSNHYSDFCCLCGFYGLFQNFTDIKFYNVCSFLSGFFSLNIMFARFISIIGCRSSGVFFVPLFWSCPLHEYAIIFPFCC